jgi:hypothetical protein
MSVIRGLLIGIALLLPPAANGADALGRLFFSPEQRVQLDTLRIRKVVSSQTKDEPPPEFVNYSGIIRRSDGQTTVWVNNQALSEADLREQPAIAGRISRDGKILLGAGKGSMQLKVGQSAELLSGQISESYDARKAATTSNAQPKVANKQSSTPDDKAIKDEESTIRKRDNDENRVSAAKARTEAEAALGSSPRPAEVPKKVN